jgi:hypothetical protein
MAYLLGLVFGDFNLLQICHLFQPPIGFTDRYLTLFKVVLRDYFIGGANFVFLTKVAKFIRKGAAD